MTSLHQKSELNKRKRGDFPVSTLTQKYKKDLIDYIVYSGNITYGYNRQYLIDTNNRIISISIDIISDLNKIINNINIEKE